MLKMGVLALTIPLFTSINNSIRIPSIKKLREIEQDKYEKHISDCKCKSFRYNMNLREAGEEVCPESLFHYYCYFYCHLFPGLSPDLFPVPLPVPLPVSLPVFVPAC